MTTRPPGQRTGISTTPRNIIIGGRCTLLPGPIVIDATYAIDGANTNKTDELRAGCLMARIDSGLWVPLKRTAVTSGTTGSGSGKGNVALTVDDARFFKADDPISVEVGGVATNATVSSVNYTTNVITTTAAVDNPDIGGAVIGRGDLAGSGTCRGILMDTVRLLSTEPYNTTEYDTQARILVADAIVDEDQILGDLAAVRGAARGVHYLDNIIWGDYQGKD